MAICPVRNITKNIQPMLRDMVSGLSKQFLLDKPAWYHVEKIRSESGSHVFLVVTMQTNLFVGDKVAQHQKAG